MLPPFFTSLLALLVSASPGYPQASQTDQIQIAPPMRQMEAPPKDASADQLEKQGDLLRAEKGYLDAIDYYRAALANDPQTATVSKKLAISELMLKRYRHAIKACAQ